MVIQFLSSTGILHLFDAIVTPADAKSTNLTDLYATAARQIKCDPSKCKGFDMDDRRLQTMQQCGMETVDVRQLSEYPVYDSEHPLAAMGCPRYEDSSAGYNVSMYIYILLPFLAIVVTWMLNTYVGIDLFSLLDCANCHLLNLLDLKRWTNDYNLI
mmetsp:Transcript_23569/g.34574  ORF Transcript_23569/g.34574 Transcript_23569/m.34574 type:complete len:157 (+) Transcript_23569:401-871(+)